jgi:hypothetical protein
MPDPTDHPAPASGQPKEPACRWDSMSSHLAKFSGFRFRSRGRFTNRLAGAVVLAVVATGGLATAYAAGSPVATPASSGSSGSVHLASEQEAKAHETPVPCAAVKHRGDVVCHSVVFSPNTTHQIVPDAAGPPVGSLGPADIQAAYALPAGGGSGQTVAIIDAYGASTVESDLATFRSQYGLPACTTANGCFRKVDQRGGTSYPGDDAGWALETALDVDAVSAACPACNILLVEGDTADVNDLGAAVQMALALGAKFVSNSYGVPGEGPSLPADHDYQHKGAVIVASTGDTGNEVSWPASDPYVVAVGGTTLVKDTSTPRGWTETAWADGGSGCSAYEPKPDYQQPVATRCANRAIADIAADADPQTGLAVYDTLGQSGWLRVGGTSLSSPLLAAMFAMAGTPNPDAYPVAGLYDPSVPQHLFDVTSGSDGSCGNVLCTAGPGWDGPTGLGTPNGIGGLRLGQGPHGAIAGTVTDTATGDPIPGAQIVLSAGEHTSTDRAGRYTFSYLDVGTYDLTVSAYSYPAKTITGISVSDGASLTEDVTLTQSPEAPVSGTVTDASGHGWPLYAEITIDGYPNGPIFTDPTTGKYRVTLPASTDYTMHVNPVYDGYQAQTHTVHLEPSGSTSNVALTVDATSCTAPGYGRNGVGTDFIGWTGSTGKDGWTVSGSSATWRFDDPTNRQAPPGGDDNFAIADSSYTGTKAVRTVLTSPTIDLSGQKHPALTFDTVYIGARGQTGAVDLSIDNGHHWVTIWKHTDDVLLGSRLDSAGIVPDPVSLDLSGASGQSQARVRFDYTGSGGYWAIDNVLAGTGACVARPGGLVIGNASDAASGTDLAGVKVYRTADAAHPATTVATVDDKNLRDGFYWLFVPVGSNQLTASAEGYATAQQTVAVTANQVITRNWALTTQ